MLARRQRHELLVHVEVLHPVHVGAARNLERHLADAVGAVHHDVEAAHETEILRVVRCQCHFETTVAAYHHGVTEKVAVETYGIARTDRTDEGKAQQAHIVLVDVHVCECIFEHGIEDIARCKQLVQPRSPFTGHNVFFRQGILAIDVTRNVFLKCHGQDELSSFLARFHMVFQKRHALETAFLKHLFSKFVNGKRQFLVFVVAEVIVLTQVVVLLGGNDLTHELHGRVFLAAVLLALAFHRGFLQHALLHRQADVNHALALLHFFGYLAVADAGEDQRAVHADDGILSVVGRGRSHRLALIAHRGEGHGLTGLGVGHHAGDACGLAHCRQCGQQQENREKEKSFQCRGYY